MKVYVVRTCDHDDMDAIVGVFASKEKAQEAEQSVEKTGQWKGERYWGAITEEWEVEE